MRRLDRFARAREVETRGRHPIPAFTDHPGAPMITWEYMTTPLLIHNTAAILNNWGKQGWELVQVVPGPEGGLVGYFKRPTGGGAANTGLDAAATAAQQFGE